MLRLSVCEPYHIDRYKKQSEEKHASEEVRHNDSNGMPIHF